MIFDQPPAELPVATLRPHDAGAQLLLDARRWLAARWRWFRPRAIPVAAAFAGMLAVVASANYLRDLAHRLPEQVPAQVHAVSRADDPLPRVRVDQLRPGASAAVAKRLLQRPVLQRPVLVNQGQPVELQIGGTVYRLDLNRPSPNP